MIISHRGHLAAASLILFLGGQVDAGGQRGMRRDGPTGTPTLGSNDAGATDHPIFFETEWQPQPFQSPYAVEKYFELFYTVTASEPAIAAQGALPMVLLWTSATSGMPTAANTYEIMAIQCEHYSSAKKEW
jgi:hypothetical protein